MDDHEHVFDDRTPGVEEHEPTASYLSYTAGLGLAILRGHGSGGAVVFIIFSGCATLESPAISAPVTPLP